MHPDLAGKRLELLKEVIPKLSRVAVLSNPANPIMPPLLRETEAAARALGVQLQVVEVRDPTDFDSAFSAMTRERAGALVVLPDAIFQNERRRIAGLAAKARLPAMYAWKEAVDDGGLMAYGASVPDIFRRAATYVDKILKSTKPADLPVEQPLAILPTRLRFSQSLLLRSFSRSLWRGLRRRRATPAWGEVRSLATPRAASIPRPETVPSLATARAAKTRPMESMRSFSTPRATSTPPTESMRSLAIPRATSTPPAESRRSITTPRVTTTPPAEAVRSF